MMKLYLEHVFECSHRKITVRVPMLGRMAWEPARPWCLDCGPYAMPMIRQEDGERGAQYIHYGEELPLSLFVHEHNDKEPE